MTSQVDSAGSVCLVGVLPGGAAAKLMAMSGSENGLSKDTRSDNWQAKAGIAKGSFIK